MSRQLPDPLPPEVLGARIQRLRQDRNLSQRQCYEALGVSHTAWSRWEQGAAGIRVSELPRIAALFDVTCEWLLRPVTEEPVYLLDKDTLSLQRRAESRDDPSWQLTLAFRVDENFTRCPTQHLHGIRDELEGRRRSLQR